MRVILYSTHCPQCTVLENRLKEKEIPYEKITDKAKMISKGFSRVPMLDVDGRVIGFKDAIKWVEEY